LRTTGNVLQARGVAKIVHGHITNMLGYKTDNLQENGTFNKTLSLCFLRLPFNSSNPVSVNRFMIETSLVPPEMILVASN